jgi:hypothetical protein
MDKLLAKDVSRGRIQDIEAKEARDRITVLDYDTQGIKGFRDADMVIEVISSSWCTRAITLITPTGCLREHKTEAVAIRIHFRGCKPKLHHGFKYILDQYHEDCCSDHPPGRVSEFWGG